MTCTMSLMSVSMVKLNQTKGLVHLMIASMQEVGKKLLFVLILLGIHYILAFIQRLLVGKLKIIHACLLKIISLIAKVYLCFPT